MKRKGFTLVELIAVIVVVAVIALIAVPLVMNQIENTKKEAYKTSVQSVFDALSTYLAHNTEIDDIPSSGILIPGDEIYTQLDLKNADFITGGKIIRDENGVMVAQNISNGTYCASGSKNDLQVTKGGCEKLDSTAPKIDKIVASRVTPRSITIVVEAKDEESGIIDYTYFIKKKSDKESDNEYEKKATKKDNVYTFTGLDKDTTYDIKVVVTNRNEKTAEKTIQAQTEDMDIDFKETPQGWSHSKTVTITYPKVTGTEVYQYQIVGNPDWITVEGTTVDVLLDNPATITAKILQDGKEILAKNKSYTTIDNLPPVIKEIVGNDGWSISKQLTINANDDGGSGLADEPYSFDGGKTWQKSPNSKVFTSEEIVQIAVRDKLGNVSDVQTVQIKQIDTTEVTGSTITAKTGKGETYTSNEWANKSDKANNGMVVQLCAKPTVTNLPAEKTESPVGYTYQWYRKDGNSYIKVGGDSPCMDLTQNQVKTYKVEIKVKGRVPSKTSGEFIVKIDAEPPTCPTTWSGESTSWATSRTIKATCTDTGGSGCTSATASKTWVFDKTTETANLSYDMADNAGNTIMCNKQAADIYVDKTKPTINRKSTTSSTNSIGINFEVSDEHSGVDTDSYDCVFGTNVSGTITYNRKGTIKNGACTITGVSAGTRYYYQITASDTLGNTTTTDDAYVETKSIQAVAISFPDNNQTTWTTEKKVTLTYNKTDITNPGYFFRYSGTAKAYNTIYQCTTDKNRTPSKADCTTTIKPNAVLTANTWYYVMDSGTTTTTSTFTATSNGTITAVTSDGVNTKYNQNTSITKIDNEGPRTGTITKSTTTKSVAFTYAASDSQSGVKSVTCSVQGTTSGATASGTTTSCSINNLRTGSYNYTITLTDNVGNVTTSTGTFETVNFSKCKVAVPGGWATQKTVTITGVTAGAQLQYRIGTNGTWNNISNGGTFNLTSNERVYCRLTDGTNTRSGASAGVTGIDRSTPKVYISALTDSVQNIAYSEGTWTKDMVQLTANPSGSTSGYSYQWYTVSSKSGASSEYKQIVGATGQKYTITSDVNTYYVVKVTNGAGTSSYSTPFSVRRDATPPSKPTYSAYRYGCSGTSCTYTSGTWAYQRIETEIESSDSGSGVAQIQYSLDSGATWTKLKFADSNGLQKSGTKYSGTEGWTAKDRNDTVYFRAVDGVGNVSGSTSAFNIKIDMCQTTTASYGSWGTCSKTCGGGTQTRTVTNKGISGKTCSTSPQSQSCNTQSCSSSGIDCSSLSNNASWRSISTLYTGTDGENNQCNRAITYSPTGTFIIHCNSNRVVISPQYHNLGNHLFRITISYEPGRPTGQKAQYYLSDYTGSLSMNQAQSCLGTIYSD